MKKIIALILVIVSIFSVTSISVYAEDTNENKITVTVNEVEFIFDANTSEEHRNKVIAHYFDHGEDVAAYGLTCTLFGHKIESSVVVEITHKAKATDPRCLEKTYNAETCSRCDYTKATLLGSTYISCC